MANNPAGGKFIDEVHHLQTSVNKWVHELKDNHPVPNDVKNQSDAILKELKRFAKGELADHIGILTDSIHALAGLEKNEDVHHPQKHEHAVKTAERKLQGHFMALLQLAKRIG